MKIRIEVVDDDAEEELIFRCREVSDETKRKLEQIANRHRTVIGYRYGEIHKLRLEDILYFEVVENRAFFYCARAVYESRMKLYEFEALCADTPLFRASKSLVINSDKIEAIAPSFSGRFEVQFINGERVIVSRQYVRELKKRMGI